MGKQGHFLSELHPGLQPEALALSALTSFLASLSPAPAFQLWGSNISPLEKQ